MKVVAAPLSEGDKPVVTIFWFRRDLRLQDNAGLFYALKEKIQIGRASCRERVSPRV